ncbi:MAG TPA: cation diffusion facilitator family transporter [Chloroflexota bacterium]
MEPSRSTTDLGALKLAVGLYALLFVIKLGVYFATGVMALLAESFHTLSDVFIYAFLLVAALYSRKQPDAIHMFGYGRAQNVAALVAATLFISFTSFKLYEEAIPRLFGSHDAVYGNLGWAVAVLGLSMLVAGAPLVGLLRTRQPGAAARAQLIALLNDELGLLAALVGTLLLGMGIPLADPIATLVVATVIAISAIGLFRDNMSFLLGRSPGSDYLARVEAQARSVPGVLGVHELRAEYIGPDTVHAGMHVEVRPDLSIGEADQIAEEVRRRVHASSDTGYCVIHVEPAAAPTNPRAQGELSYAATL